MSHLDSIYNIFMYNVFYAMNLDFESLKILKCFIVLFYLLSTTFKLVMFLLLMSTMFESIFYLNKCHIIDKNIKLGLFRFVQDNNTGSN